mmetsp:Transcript_13366/g.21852  ORF Transcript_13366/g.21852 Transcript_13366/m.21852 type:complete len:99 (-) Transcript_13366:891-1187(-)
MNALLSSNISLSALDFSVSSFPVVASGEEQTMGEESRHLASISREGHIGSTLLSGTDSKRATLFCECFACDSESSGLGGKARVSLVSKIMHGPTWTER